ncbi:MAG: glycosyltransferase family 39 protein, partial [Candidatus Omnitrophota bacterium]
SILYYFWIRAFGDSEVSMRIPALAFGLSGVVLMYLVGSAVFGDDIGFPAALATVFSIAYITYSTEAVHAIFELPILMASLLCLYKFIMTRKRRMFAGLLLLNAAGVFIFYHYLAYLMIQTAVLWLYRKRLGIRGYYFTAVALLVAVFCWYAASSFSEGHFSYGFWLRHDLKTIIKVIGTLPYRGIGVVSVPARYAGIFFFRHFFAFFSLSFLLLFLAGYARILFLFRRIRDPRNLLKLVLAAVFAVPFVFYLATGALGLKFGHPRNFFYLLPVYFLIMFYGLRWLIAQKKAFYFFSTAAVLFFLISGAVYATHYWSGAYEQRRMIEYGAKLDADYVFIPTTRIEPWVFQYYTKKYNCQEKVHRLYTTGDSELIRREDAELDYREQFKKVPPGKRIAVVETKDGKVLTRFVPHKSN